MRRHLLVILLNLVVGHHVVNTVFYLSPNNPLSKYYEPYVLAYMQPFFYQNWDLFARSLRSNWPVLRYRCVGKNKWRDFASGVLHKHVGNRFAGEGKRFYYYNYLVGQVTKAYTDNVNSGNFPDRNKMLKTPEAEIIFNILIGVCKSSVEAELVIISQPKYSDAGKKPLIYESIPIFNFGLVDTL